MELVYPNTSCMVKGRNVHGQAKARGEALPEIYIYCARGKTVNLICLIILKINGILIYNTIKDPQWYAVQEGDATMIPIAASLLG